MLDSEGTRRKAETDKKEVYLNQSKMQDEHFRPAQAKIKNFLFRLIKQFQEREKLKKQKKLKQIKCCHNLRFDAEFYFRRIIYIRLSI